MKINQLIAIATVALLSANLAWAEENKTQAPANENVVQKITGQEKKTRKKKAEMCGECGKPESECECHGHDKKEDKSSSENKK